MSANITKLSNTNLKNICRTCLLKDGVTSLNEIFKQEAMNIRQLLQMCTNIQVQYYLVEDDDNLPQNICSVCTKELLTTYEFITKCKHSDSVLHTLQPVWQPNVQTIEILKENERKVKLENDSSERLENFNNAEAKIKDVTKLVTKNINVSQLNKAFRTKSYKSKKSLKYSNKIANRTCSTCAKVLSTPFLLKQHMRSHTNERPYKCDVCSAAFTNSSNLRRHARTHTGEKPHVCDICNKAYTQATTLMEHKRSHTGETPYVCCYCGKCFRSYSNHKTHLLKHHLENTSLNEDDKILKERLNDIVCKVCGRVLSTKGALKTHMLIHGEKSFLCSDCGKCFFTKLAFLSHFRTHTGEKPYKCDRCEKSFSVQANLKQHILIHTGEKPYRCKICSKGFVQYHQLKYHSRTHSGERPYICSYCGKAFALNGNLTVHKRIHTGETPYHCSVCNRGFYDSSSMKKHQKGHEKGKFIVSKLDDTQIDSCKSDLN